MKGQLNTLNVRVPKFKRDKAVERDSSPKSPNLEFKPLPLNKY